MININEDTQPTPSERTGQDHPWQKINLQLRTLDDALLTIPWNASEEAKIVRQYIVGQIEALKWVVKFYEV